MVVHLLFIAFRVVYKDGSAVRIELSESDFGRRRGNVTRFWHVRAVGTSREIAFVSSLMSGGFGVGEVLSSCK